jgi:hypothetical protein
MWSIHLSLEEWGVIAAIVSAITTVALAALTLSLAQTGRASSRAAEEASRLVQHQLKESLRPVLIPEAPRPDPDDPRRVLIPVRNIGAGPALNLSCRARTSDLPEGVLGRFPLTRVSGAVAARESTDLAFLAASVTEKTVTTVELTFSDVAGQRYTTRATWDRRSHAFGAVRIQDREGLKLERIPERTNWQRTTARVALRGSDGRARFPRRPTGKSTADGESRQRAERADEAGSP